MFYQCVQVEGTECLLNLDLVRYLEPAEHKGRPATMVIFSDGTRLMIQDDVHNHMTRFALMTEVYRIE